MKKEKARLGAELIPNSVWQDKTELSLSLKEFQASRLAHRCAMSAAMAEILAPLVFPMVLS